jgi:hypothetical protein
VEDAIRAHKIDGDDFRAALMKATGGSRQD